jgi:immune inhibitor A
MKRATLRLLLLGSCLSLIAAACAPEASSAETHTPVHSPTPAEPSPIGPVEMAQALACEELPALDMPERKVRIGVLPAPVVRTTSAVPRAYVVGDTEEFKVFDSFDPSAQVRVVEVELRYVTDHAYTWVEVGASVDSAALEQAAERFENEIYPSVRFYFGEEWSPGVDNDPRISMLHVSGLGQATAFFGSNDEYLDAVLPGSNEREMFYVGLDNLVIGSDLHLAVLAHEFQHMVQWNNPGNESHALDEGLAQLAELLAGFENTVKTGQFMANCRTQLNSWVEGRVDEGRYYAANYLFSLYLWERLGDDFIRALSRHPGESLNSINATLAEEGHDSTVDDLFAEWIVANYLDDTTIGDGRYGYRSAQLEPICPRERPAAFPWEQAGTMPQYSAEYIELEGQGQASVRFEGATTAQLIPADAHSGHSFWWSNRGDEVETTLTRSFDLAGLESATLEYWTWYDIQVSGYEFACLAVSTDDGQTWTYPNTKQATRGAVYPCYNGVSGGGSEPGWVAEEIDLSAYAGEQILVRFEYLTESWFNRPGFAVDDISVPELEYTCGAETGDDGWDGEGFVRTSNQVPQGWALQLLTVGPQVAVQRLEVDENGRSSVDLDLHGGSDKAVLIVGAMAPSTKEEARYTVQITGDLTGGATAGTAYEGALYWDEFGDVCSGWMTYEDSQQSRGYDDGAYYIQVQTPQSSALAYPGQDFANTTIDVDTVQAVPATDNSWGVVCRYQDPINYYGFEIGNDGLYTIYAVVNGQTTPIVGWTASGAIQTGQGASNHLKVTCDAARLALEVNGHLVTQVTDSSLASGDVGVIATAYSEAGPRLLFDNFVVRQP